MRAYALAFAGLALLSACQDSSQVGLGLIDDDVPTPGVRVLGATAVDTVAYDLVTSGFADLSSPSQTRVLVGNVRDALYGDAQATAYLDAIVPSQALPSGFADRPVTSVRLELRRDYAYGDTTAAFPVELRQVTATWAPTGLPADTTLATGSLLTTATVRGADSLAVFDLPQSWLDANVGLFTRSTFSSDFEGFELRAPTVTGDGAVFGFNVARIDANTAAKSFLRVATARDTVRFRISEVFSRLTPGMPGMAPPGRLLLRAGSGTGAQALVQLCGRAAPATRAGCLPRPRRCLPLRRAGHLQATRRATRDTLGATGDRRVHLHHVAPSGNGLLGRPHDGQHRPDGARPADPARACHVPLL